MSDVILNPRRVPRAPAACEARCLLPGGGFWASDTTDVSPGGIQLQAPGPFTVGDPIKLTLRSERVEGLLATTGRVAWATKRPPWRIGVAFDEPFVGESARWFERLLAAYPGLATFRLAPSSLELSTTLFLAAPPRVAPELTGDEVTVLRAVGAGVTPARLKAQHPDVWPALEGTLFALLGKKYLTLDPGAAGTPEGWQPYLPAAR
jgi:hypothetical protein